jgi:hypothetical protein
MTTPAWANDLHVGLGALIAELEAAESSQVGLGKKPDWDSIKAKAASIKAHVATALHDFGQQNEKLKNAAKYIERLQEELKPMQAAAGARSGVGQAPTGQQTVYLSAGATAGIAAGALLIGAVGGYATKAIVDAGKQKKLAEEAKAKELAAAARETPEEHTRGKR